MSREIKFRAWNHKKMIYYPIMQFTGQTDKNDKDIYEGDIIDNGHGRIGVVVYDEERAMFIVADKMKFNDSLYHFKSPEIIGDKFQNPELLK